MQGKNQFIDDISAHLKAFKLKLNLFAGQLAKNDLSHFSRLNSIPSVNEEKLKNYEDGLKRLHFEFEHRFQDFSATQTELDIFTMPFNVNCEAVMSNLQLELIELQSNNHLKQSFLNMPKLEFYKSLSKQPASLKTIRPVWTPSDSKLNIHGQSTLHEWRGSTPHHSNFKSIHLGESFTGRTAPTTDPSPMGITIS
ncbi:hypothetical protein AVEN_208700-1 [Araneus ventricosus]|uniref:General transcription factor II-I repeat domain-containing protein 2 n=1 Tax=Araneus ventricosus TaxID=182803 RepID=A0A4Y2FEY4_ARAVE|nr:hypothetical protein AVEN_208700-1 [Araneus ventricosus]